MIAAELEAIFAGQDVNGETDVDGVLDAFEKLLSKATKKDLPELVDAIQSPRNNFWTRELLSEPICHLGGSEYLEQLLDAAQLNRDEGHDNDGFDFHLSELAATESENCREKLKELLSRETFPHLEKAEWLLEFCKPIQA